ncbi:MAG: hypothetical protein HYY66_07185 [Candidatus Tectomicrobia bacterium]|nr:hypothetical protein [Candidatus Tectomicrobia bacterium]
MFTHPLLLILSIAAAGAVYVLIPVAADAFGRFRSRRQVECPETGRVTSIQVDAELAARTAIFGGPRLRVSDCRDWPARQGCGRKCLEKAG